MSYNEDYIAHSEITKKSPTLNCLRDRHLDNKEDMDKTIKVILLFIAALFALLFVFAIVFVAYSVFIVS